MTCTKQADRLQRIQRNLERIEKLMLELQRMSMPIDEGNAKAKLMVIEGDRTECSETNS